MSAKSLPSILICVSALLGLSAGVGACVYDWPKSAISGDGGADAGDSGDGGPACGNGRIETGEQCDDQMLGGETCGTQGFGGGELACASDCTFDTTGCVAQVECGDGYLGAGEGCDDGDLDSGDGCDATCMVEPGYACEGEPSVCSSGCGNGVCYPAGGEDATSCPADCAWVQVSAGLAHTCALKGDGTVWCWGDNASGQLGDGSSQDRDAPVQVLGLASVTQVACGDAHTCAVTEVGAVWCWGANGDGQLGNGTIISSDEPVAASNLFDAVRLAAGAAHTCVTTSGAQAWCWGRNTDGQLGDGTPVSRQEPTAVSIGAGLDSAKDITAGGRHSCAVRNDDTVWCWGANDSGQLGVGTVQPSLLPRAVDTAGGFAGAQVVSAGAAHTCALDLGGAPWCWGEADRRRVGDGGTQDRPSPVSVLDVGTALDIAAGAEHGCAVATGGTLWCWGSGADGRLGIGSSPPQANPTAIAAPTNGAQVTAGGSHGCALTADGELWCWGAGSDGQLGDGTATTQTAPVLVNDPY